LGKVGLDSDPYLLRFNGAEKVRLVGGFAVSICRGDHSAPRHEGPLVSGTVKQAISNLASSFTTNDHPDPRRNDDGDIHPHLQMMYRAYARTDPKVEAQKAITPEHLAYLYSRDTDDDFGQHTANLCNGAFFFACRSCEYSQTKGTRKTKIITIGNIAFRTGNQVHKDPKNI
jgi:hypothetical protein